VKELQPRTRVSACWERRHYTEAVVLGPDLLGCLDPLHALGRTASGCRHHHLGKVLQYALVQLGGNWPARPTTSTPRHGPPKTGDACEPFSHEVVGVGQRRP